MSLPWLALVVASAPLIAAVTNAVQLFGRRRPWLAPRPSLVTRAAARQLLSASGLFFLSQLALNVQRSHAHLRTVVPGHDERKEFRS